MPDPITGTIKRCTEIGSDYPDSITCATAGDINAGTHAIRGCHTDAITPVNNGRIKLEDAGSAKRTTRGLSAKRE